MLLFTCSVCAHDVEAADRAAARRRPQDAAQHANGRRLPGAVRPEEAEHRAALDAQIDVVDRDELIEHAREAGDFDGEGGHGGIEASVAIGQRPLRDAARQRADSCRATRKVRLHFESNAS